MRQRLGVPGLPLGRPAVVSRSGPLRDTQLADFATRYSRRLHVHFTRSDTQGRVGRMGDQTMLGAATLFTATTVFTTVVSAREQHLPDEPLGFRLPGPVPVHLALGLGSGVAAPWPMPIVAVVAAMRAGPDVRWPERTCAILGAGVLVGTLVEPASWGLRPRSARARATVPLHLLSGAALFLAGTRRMGGAV